MGAGVGATQDMPVVGRRLMNEAWKQRQRTRRSSCRRARDLSRAPRALFALCAATLIVQGCRLMPGLRATPTGPAPTLAATVAPSDTPLPTSAPTATASATPTLSLLVGPAGTIIAVQTRYYTPLLPVIETTPVSGAPVGTVATRAPLLPAPTGTPAPEVPIHTATPSATRTPTATCTGTATSTPTATPSATATP